MDHLTAAKLMAIYERAGHILAEANDLIRDLPETERHAHLRPLGDMMADVWLKLQLPIVREHRDLDPDGDRFQKHLK